MKSLLTPKNLFRSECLLWAISFGLLLGAIIMVYGYVPSERTMGAIQRIFYFHVASAMATYTAVAVIFFASVSYLTTQSLTADTVNRSASEVSLVFCSIVLFTGMLWGRPIWNTWFHWEPRLVSFLLLWLILLALNFLRRFDHSPQQALHAAVLGIVSVVTIPLVIFSINLLPQLHQMHPKLERQGLTTEMRLTLLVATGAIFCLTVFFIVLRSHLGNLERKGDGVLE